jgi:hypothetical protein
VGSFDGLVKLMKESTPAQQKNGSGEVQSRLVD